MKNIFFCDIDGTIIDGTRGMVEPSEYTRYAFKELLKNNYVFIASGRCKVLLPNWIFDLNPSGYVLCNGSYVECDNKVIFNECFDENTLNKIKEVVTNYNGFYLNENKDKMYVNDFDLDAFNLFVKSWKLDINDYYAIDDDVFRDYNIAMIGFTNREDCLKMEKELSSYVDLEIHNRKLSYDCNIKGINKGVGVKKAIEYLNIDPDNSYAFGDAINDLGMLKAVKNPVVMGNGSKELKAYGFTLTDDVINDGLYKYLVDNKLIMAK